MQQTTHISEYEKPIPDPQTQVNKSIELYETILSRKYGKIVFVAGDKGSGKTEVLSAIAKHFSNIKSSPYVIYGEFSNRKYEPILPKAKLSARTGVDAVGNSLSALAKILGIRGIPPGLIVEGLDVVCDFVGQMAQTGASVQSALIEMNQNLSKVATLPLLMKRLLRRAAEEKSVVCLFDDFDEAQRFEWLEFLNCFADEINIDMQLLLFISLEGKATVGEHKQGEAETGLENIARRLIKNQLAEWWYLPPMTREEIAKWIGLNTAPGIVSQLHGVTGGTARWVRDCWHDWKLNNAVYYNEVERCWQWSVKNKPGLDLFNGILGKRIEAILRKQGFNPHNEAQQAEYFNRYNEIKQILGVAALEGELFTADAIALVLDWDRDELINFFDEELVLSDENPNGVLREEDFFTIKITPDNERNLCRYSFTSDWFWLAADKFGLVSETEKVQKTADLIAALQLAYEGEIPHVAPTLAKLCRAIKYEESSNHFQRIADFQTRRETMHELALHLINQNYEDWDTAKCRYVAKFLTEAVEVMHLNSPYRDVIDVCEVAATLARKGGDVSIQAYLLYISGYTHSILGDNLNAKIKADIALSIYVKEHNKPGVGLSLHLLGQIAYKENRLEEARAIIKKGLEIAEELGENSNVGALLIMLGRIANKEKKLDESRVYIEKALKIAEKTSDKYGMCVALGMLGRISLYQQKLNEARKCAEKLHEIAEEIFDIHGIELSLDLLGRICRNEKKFDEGCTFALKALTISFEFDDKQKIGGNIGLLGQLFFYKGKLDVGIRLTAIAYIIFEMIESDDITITTSDLGSFTAKANYSLQDLENVLNKAEQEYTKDEAKTWIRELLQSAIGEN